MRATAYERILDALTNDGRAVRPRGDRQATAQCPAHEDRNPSLSITAIDGQALLHCHAGCPTNDVLGALQLSMSDLFDEPRGSSYHYADRAGTILRTVTRSPDKQFRQSGQTRGTSTLYRLPEVVQAVAAGRIVYLVEGEKDVHAVEAVGGVATTAPMGASNFKKVDAEPLRGARVMVLIDRDEAGARWAADVHDHLHDVVANLAFVQAATGKDAADHVAAGHGLEEFTAFSLPSLVDSGEQAEPEGQRRIRVRAATEFHVRPVRWLWDGRVALGTLALCAGREGIGKSTVAYSLTADITRGTLDGQYFGIPKGVLVAATEDSWEHTIVPRLMAAGADLTRVYAVDVTSSEGVETGLSLPRDLVALERTIKEKDVALVLLDPLMSRLAGDLDTHKDADVRIALEPLVRIADRSGAAMLGLIHVNKSSSVDPLNTVMASRAFTAVARSVLFVMTDPDDENVRLLGTPKNNLGSTDLPTRAFTIEGVKVADTDEGPVWSSRVAWTGTREQSIREVLEQSAGDAESRSSVAEAADWVEDYLASVGGEAASTDVKAAAMKAGHAAAAVQRARARLRLVTRSEGFPRHTVWALPPQSSQPVVAPPGESATTATTATTGPDLRRYPAPPSPVVAVVAVVADRDGPATTGQSSWLDDVPLPEEPPLEDWRDGGEAA